MNEERMNPNFDLESCLRNKVDEAKRYLEDKHKRQKDGACEEPSYAESFIYYFQNVETILDLYKKTKYELKGKEALVDTMSHNEEVLTRNYEILEKKLQQEKEKNKELEEKQNRLAFKTNQYMNDVLTDNIVSKDKIKEKLEYATKMVKFYTTNEPDHILIPIYNEVIKLCKELLEEE